MAKKKVQSRGLELRRRRKVSLPRASDRQLVSRFPGWFWTGIDAERETVENKGAGFQASSGGETKCDLQ